MRPCCLFWFYLTSLNFGLFASEKPNVLLICVDDLRPELGCYGKEYIQSPQIDALAKSGTLFENHYVQAPTCGSSRAAMLTGRYGSRSNASLFERANKLAQGKKVNLTMPEWFRKQGYTTVAIGKVSHHPGGFDGPEWNDKDKPEMPGSWDRSLLPAGPWQHPKGWMHGLANGEIREKAEEMSVYQAVAGPDSIYPDGVMIPEAISQLQSLAQEEKPFFLAVGILRPHLPFGAPKKYLDLYQGVELPPIPHPNKPEGRTTWHQSGEFNKYKRWGKDANKDAAFADEVRRHYAACVSYADTMVGKVMQALEQTGAKENTIVVLWGDHGWHLGEHGIWGKHSLFEESLRSPLIISYPKQKIKNERSSAVVQSVDLFPTLCTLANMAPPQELDGESLLPFLENPKKQDPTQSAISYFGIGKTVRTAEHRLIVQKDGLVELYEHPLKYGETENIAEENPEIVARLQKQLEGL